MNEPNTIWVKAYTPNGTQVGITIGFEDGKLTPANHVDAMLEAAGYLVVPKGLEVGESVENITHVMRRTRHADDGRVIPIIAFYIDNPKFENKYDHIYMDGEKDIKDITKFEAWSGLKLGDIPEFEGTTWLERKNNPTATKYIKALPEPKQVAVAMGTWRNPKTNESGETMKIQRFLGVTTSTPDNVIQMPTGSTSFTREIARDFLAYWDSQGLNQEAVLTHLGIQGFGEWQDTVDDANAVLAQKVSA